MNIGKDLFKRFHDDKRTVTITRLIKALKNVFEGDVKVYFEMQNGNIVFIVLAVFRQSVLRVCVAHLRVIAPGEQLLLKKYCSGGESLATLCLTRPAR